MECPLDICVVFNRWVPLVSVWFEPRFTPRASLSGLKIQMDVQFVAAIILGAFEPVSTQDLATIAAIACLVLGVSVVSNQPDRNRDPLIQRALLNPWITAWVSRSWSFGRPSIGCLDSSLRFSMNG